MKEFEKYFIIDEFEDGWGMENVESEEQLFDYCTEVLFIPDDKIEIVTTSMISLYVRFPFSNVPFVKNI